MLGGRLMCREGYDGDSQRSRSHTADAPTWAHHDSNSSNCSNPKKGVSKGGGERRSRLPSGGESRAEKGEHRAGGESPINPALTWHRRSHTGSSQGCRDPSPLLLLPPSPRVASTFALKHILPRSGGGRRRAEWSRWSLPGGASAARVHSGGAGVGRGGRGGK